MVSRSGVVPEVVVEGLLEIEGSVEEDELSLDLVSWLILSLVFPMVNKVAANCFWSTPQLLGTFFLHL